MEDRLRVLIVGAGIGGMTLAALLERRGLRPMLIERAASFEHAGYMLGLWPIGARVLHGLGLHPRLVEGSIEARFYEVYDGSGELIHRWDMQPLSSRIGPMYSCTRPQVVELLETALEVTRIRFSTTVDTLEIGGSSVRVTLTDGHRGDYDLVVAADGIHSEVRAKVFGDAATFDTGWGGWVWYADLSTVPEATFVEHWGAGRFVGAYPTQRGVGLFMGTRRDELLEDAGPGRSERIRARFAGMGPQVDAFLREIPGDGEPLFHWNLSDTRSDEWTKGRVVLLGDSAAGFLPTAGIGASMAMESAAVLDDELTRCDRDTIERALALYVKRRRQRVEAIQDDSRRLAHVMFVESRPVAAVRDFVTQFVSLEALGRSIARAMDEPA